MQTILATGATGLVGSRFAEMFGAKYNVANMDLTTGVDITNIDTVQECIKAHKDAKFLIHLAAFTDPNAAFAQTGDKDGICYKVNVEGTRNITKICKEAGLHLIHVSTDFVFDGKKESPYTEEDQRSPIEWYGTTKAIAEEVVEGSGASYTIARISYPYRAHFELKSDLIMKIRQGLEHATLPPQFSDSIMTPTFTDDIARAFDLIIQKSPGGILHITGSSALSPFELAKKVARAYGFDEQLVKEGSLREYLKNSPRPFAQYASIDNRKATETLGCHFATIDEGLAALKKQQL